MEPNTEKELVIDMDAVIDQARGAERPSFYYASETQQTRFTCGECGEFNDIRGLYSYCAACATRNNLSSFREAADSLRDDLNNTRSDPTQTVRLSVSKFDACCRDFVAQLVKQIPMRSGRKTEFERLKFHDIDNDTFKRLKAMLEIDPLKGIQNPDLAFVKMMLRRRHVYEHNDGVADQKYVEGSGDVDIHPGVLIRETHGNANRLLGLLVRMVENFQADFHAIIAPNDGPINSYHAHKTRMAEINRQRDQQFQRHS